MSLHDPNDLFSKLRYLECLAVRRYFPEQANLLEIGGGSGFQAALLASWGHRVVSLDLRSMADWEKSYFYVMPYDGRRFPIHDGCMNIVYSSNVLEHIPVSNLNAVFREMQRVLSRDGLAVHVVPTAVWRFWTIVAHYPWLFKRALFGRTNQAGIVQHELREVLVNRGVWGTLKRILWPSAHGEASSSLTELFSFRRRAWQTLFESNGFEIIAYQPTGIFYTGYPLINSGATGWRRFAARVLGSACGIYVLRIANAEKRSGKRL